MKTTDEGILLHRISYSESSVIATFFTKKSGLKKFIFKGGKKKGPQLFPLSISELTYYGRLDSELLNLTAADPVLAQSFQFSPVRSAIAFFIAELLLKCIKHEEQDEAFYNFIYSTIVELDKAESISQLPVNLMIEILDFLGIKPLVEEETSTVFNLTSGTIGNNTEFRANTVDAPYVLEISKKLQNPSIKLSLSSEGRSGIIETIIDYLKLHIPGFSGLETYEIVKDVVRS